MSPIMTKQETLRYLKETEPSLSERDEKHYLRTYRYACIGLDVVEFDRPAISSTMYHDDETEGPSHTFEAFRAYNMRYFSDYGYKDWLQSREDMRKHGCCLGCFPCHPYMISKDGKGRPVFRFGDWDTEGDADKFNANHDPERYGVAHEMSELELKQFAEAVDELKADFEKRLRTYWKRYSDKVHASGYWAWR